MANQNAHKQIRELCQKVNNVRSDLALAGSEKKNHALKMMAEAIKSDAGFIQKQNQQDYDAGRANGLSKAMLDRLALTDARIEAMAQGLEEIAHLNEPVGRNLNQWHVSNGLQIAKVSVPLGVVAVIYESRPNVTADAAGLCIKSGNALILRGGSESFHSSHAIMDALQKGLVNAGLSPDLIQMVPGQDRSMVDALIKQHDYIDVVVPRGGKSLIQSLMQKSTIPLFKHLEGICHTYIHDKADKQKAIDVAVNAKLRRPGICGATETILIDSTRMNDILPDLLENLEKNQCQVRLDPSLDKHFPSRQKAGEDDWSTEYLDKIVAIKPVTGLNQAIEHINRFGSHHTDAILTEDAQSAENFLNAVDSAIVMHNTSTQFADGGEFGMGAEIGISTGKLHARGPVGIEQLTTFKYKVISQGCIRD